MESSYQDTLPPHAEALISIARWEGEGGSPMPRNEASRQNGTLTDAERHALECLGAAVVKAWNELPTAVQRALFSKVAASTDDGPAQLKAFFALVLQSHKDASTGRTVNTEFEPGRNMEVPDASGRFRG